MSVDARCGRPRAAGRAPAGRTGAGRPRPGPARRWCGSHAAGICGSDREVLRGQPARGVRPLPGHARPRVVRAPSRRSARASTRGAGRPQGRRRGLPQLPGVRPLPRRARRRCATAAYEETGLHPARAPWPTTLTLPARLLHPLPDDADLRAAALLEPAAVRRRRRAQADARPGRAGRGGRHRHARHARRAVPRRRPPPPSCWWSAPARTGSELSLDFGATDFRTRDAARRPAAAASTWSSRPPGPPPPPASAAALLRRGGRLVLTGHPGAGRRRARPDRSGRAPARGADRVRGAAGRLGARRAGLRRRAARPCAADHPRAAARPTSPTRSSWSAAATRRSARCCCGPAGPAEPSRRARAASDAPRHRRSIPDRLSIRPARPGPTSGQHQPDAEPPAITPQEHRDRRLTAIPAPAAPATPALAALGLAAPAPDPADASPHAFPDGGTLAHRDPLRRGARGAGHRAQGGRAARRADPPDQPGQRRLDAHRRRDHRDGGGLRRAGRRAVPVHRPARHLGHRRRHPHRLRRRRPARPRPRRGRRLRRGRRCAPPSSA